MDSDGDGDGYSITDGDCDDTRDDVYPYAISFVPDDGTYSTYHTEAHGSTCSFVDGDLSSVDIADNGDGTFALNDGINTRNCCFVAGVDPLFTDFVCETVTSVETRTDSTVTTDQVISGYWCLTGTCDLALIASYSASCTGSACLDDYPGTAAFPCEAKWSYLTSG